MHARQQVSQEVERLSTAQEGVVTLEQLVGLGLGLRSAHRLVRDRQWQRLSTGLYVTHNGDIPWRSLAWGGVLLGGPDARLGTTSAAHAHGLLAEPPELITVLVPHGRLLRDRLHWTFIQERTSSRSSASVGSPPRTSIDDTVLDLCATGHGEQAVGWVTEAVQRRMTTPARLRETLDQRSRHPHRRLLAELLGNVAAGAESPLEVAYLRDVERAHGLPRGRRQVVSADGRARRDVEYDEFGVVVELDGRLGHEGMSRFRDLRRDNSAMIQGKVTLRYGFADVTCQSCAVAWQVAEVLVQRGWSGYPTRCDGCRLAS